MSSNTPQKPDDTTPKYAPGMYPDEMPKAPQPKSNILTWLIGGCLGVVVLCVFCCGSGAIYLYLNAKNIAFQTFRNPVVEAIEKSNMTDADKTKVVAQIDRVGEAWAQGKIDSQQAAKIMEQFSKSPLLTLAKLQGLKELMNKSTLTEESKESMLRIQVRISRGLLEKSVVLSEVEATLAPMMVAKPNGGQEMRKFMTDAELEDIHAELLTQADNANVPDEDYEIEIGDEVKAIVDKALEGTGL